MQRIDGLKVPTGVGYLAATDTVYVASAADGSVHRLRAENFSALGRIPLGSDADSIRIDSADNEVIVGYGNGALAVVDAASGRKTGDVRLAGHTESFQLARADRRIFVNVPEDRQIAVVDRQAMQQVATWRFAGARNNFPMALDETGERVLVVYREPPTLAVFDARGGKLVAQRATCGDADDIFFDSQRQRIYISYGEGVLAVIQKRTDAYGEIARISHGIGGAYLALCSRTRSALSRGPSPRRRSAGDLGVPARTIEARVGRRTANQALLAGGKDAYRATRRSSFSLDRSRRQAQKRIWISTPRPSRGFSGMSARRVAVFTA